MQDHSTPLDTTTDRLYTIRKRGNWQIKRSGHSKVVVVWRSDDHELGPAWCEMEVPLTDRDALAREMVDAVHGPAWLFDELVDVMNGGARMV